jgi:hypothetical protein
LEYIAGYSAKKYKTGLPNLGDYTYKIITDDYYIIKPSEQFSKKVKKWNLYFRKGQGVVQNLAKKIFKTETTLPFKLIKDFCKLRLMIRMIFLNLKAKFTSGMKRKLPQDDIGRKKN